MSFGETEAFYGNPAGLDLIDAWSKASPRQSRCT